MAAFYKAEKTRLSNLFISVNKPCLILVSDGGTYASDPNHAGGTFSITINKRTFSVTLPPDGTTLKIR
jgi:hypothetical protein